MVAKFINDRLKDLKFALKLFYVDDLLLIADIETLHKAMKIIRDLEEMTGVRINFDKTVLYCPNESIAKRAKEVFKSTIQIESTLNIDFLKCPIGEDEYVKQFLTCKPSELKKTT